MADSQQTIPNIHRVLQAIRELEKLPEVLAYKALIASLPEPTRSRQVGR